MRTFAVERIQELSLLEERFTPIEELPDAAFPTLARRALGTARARRDRVSSRRSPITCARASGTRRSSFATMRVGRPADDARRLPRSRAAELDSELRPVRAGRRAGGARARDRGTIRGSQREVRIMTNCAIRPRRREDTMKTNSVSCFRAFVAGVSAVLCCRWRSGGGDESDQGRQADRRRPARSSATR